jgi:hypothetical protein
MGQWIPNIVSASRLSSFSSPFETARSDVDKSLLPRWFHLFDDLRSYILRDGPPLPDLQCDSGCDSRTNERWRSHQ